MSTQITTTGNLTSDPELRFTPSGKAVANVRIAVNHRIKDGDGYKDGEPTFYDITLWEQLAENAAESLQRGMQVLVTGDVHTEAWTDSDGAKRTKQVIVNADLGPSLRFATAKVTKVKREAANA